MPKAPTPLSFSQKRKRHLFARDLRNVLNSATKPIIDKRGHIFSILWKHWPEIIGTSLTNQCLLDSISFPAKHAQKGTLKMRVPSHLQAEVPYLTPIILEKCAIYLGYQPFEKIVALPLEPSKNKVEY